MLQKLQGSARQMQLLNQFAKKKKLVKRD